MSKRSQLDVFTYIRPALTIESDLTRLVRALFQELKRQVLENVVLTVHTDFDAEAGAELHLAQIAQLPGLVLMGPELAEDRFFSTNQRPEIADRPRPVRAAPRPVHGRSRLHAGRRLEPHEPSS